MELITNLYLRSFTNFSLVSVYLLAVRYAQIGCTNVYHGGYRLGVVRIFTCG